MRSRRVASRILPAAVVLLLLGSCVGGDRGVGGAARLSLAVTPASALADEPLRIRVGGLAAGERVVVSAEADDRSGRLWRSRGTFVADANGVVDVSQDAPIDGSYAGVDPMGPFWSMDPVDGDASHFAPEWPHLRGHFPVRLSAAAGQRESAAATVRRDWTTGDVTFAELSPATDGVRGMLVLPPPDVPRRPGVLLLGGSEGGLGGRYEAPLLASRGHPVLCLAYFGAADLLAALHDIPLEYFATAAGLLGRHSGGEVVAWGYSRGSEAALLLAQWYPELVRAVVVYAPSNWVNPGYPETGAAAWTLDGRPVPLGPVPLDRIDGPVLAVTGEDDEVWPAAWFTAELIHALGGSPHRALFYPDSGHRVGTFPYLPATTVYRTSTGDLSLGGTRPGDAAARRDGWPQVLEFLANS
ncbi:acyl-CoA thioesterase/bile acid-CoA:amino acid N-acyltransferase family protein [Micromonospora sp. FIMYZ51]|uniref:acyl-CoA thioesterase/bile acid-CoA:amino acid N-acyltransferase family protein n=1 Tax=Micromonospora sp. FIMYZ51 TaxID=3051832 RepID=UPI00311F85FC